MIGRQIALGLTGGVILALTALFLTTPRDIVVFAFSGGGSTRTPSVLAAARPALQQRVASSEASQVPSGSLAGPSPPSEGREGRSASEPPVQDDESSHASPLLAGLEGAPMGLAEERTTELPLEPEIEPREYKASPEQLSPDAYLGALARQVVVRGAPSHQAEVLGYVRTGTLLRRALVPVGKRECEGGWYRVEPRGYVCVGPAATLDMDHPVLQLPAYTPDRSVGMPYPYGRSRNPPPPLYSRVPTKEEQAVAEQDLSTHLRKNFGSEWEEEARAAPPPQLADGSRIPRPHGYPEREDDVLVGRALQSSTFSFIDLFESEGRRFGLTADLSLVPLDRVTRVETSEFAGLVLRRELDLPVAFVMRRGEKLYGRHRGVDSLRALRTIDYREGFALSGRRTRFGNAIFLETRGGDYLRRHDDLRLIEPRDEMPRWAKNERTWLDVSLTSQTLVAYEGKRPVYATLMSSGRDGLGDPENSYSTVQGLYLIHTKHVTASMSGEETDDEYDLRDVPYVQYFHEGYAFHAAYWHDRFGSPRSHGCINLSPADARYLFNWSDPPVPRRWHSALSREGTLVYIHP